LVHQEIDPRNCFDQHLSAVEPGRSPFRDQGPGQSIALENQSPAFGPGSHSRCSAERLWRTGHALWRAASATHGDPVQPETHGVFIDRQNLPGLFAAFDFASPDQHSSSRHTTTVPQQALFMLNNSFVVDRARALVARPDMASMEDSPAFIERHYEIIYQRTALFPRRRRMPRMIPKHYSQPGNSMRRPYCWRTNLCLWTEGGQPCRCDLAGH
jgi:hypothetical protein